MNASQTRVTAEDISYTLLAALRLLRALRGTELSPTDMRTNPAYCHIVKESVVGDVIDGRRWVLRIDDDDYVVAVRLRRRGRK